MATSGGGFAVQPAFHPIALGAQFDPGDILEPHDRPSLVGSDDDLLKFFLADQPALRPDGVGKLLSRGNRLGADLSCRVHGILLLDRVENLGDRDSEFGQHVRPHPEPHGVLPGSEDRAPARCPARGSWDH